MKKSTEFAKDAHDTLNASYERDAFNELKEHYECGTTDFTADVDGIEYRFIHEEEIDTIMQDELSGDEYVLGCFNDWFLADVLDIDCEVITAMQKAEAFEAIGKLVISLGKLEELQEAYARADGYGHHFNSYDGNEYEAGGYYIFRT